MDVLDEILKQFAGHGIVGLAVAGLGAFCYALWKAQTAANIARIEDAKNFGAKALEIQDKVHLAIDKLAEVADRLEGRTRR